MKKFLTLFVFGVLTSFVANAQYTETKDITPLGFSGDFTELQYGKSVGLIALNNYDVLYTSKDTGRTWIPQLPPLEKAQEIVMYNESLGYIYNENQMYRTIDGCATWQELTMEGLPKVLENQKIIYNKLTLKNEDTLFLAVSNKINGLKLYMSGDKGNTWKMVAKDIMNNWIGGVFLALHFDTPLIGYGYCYGCQIHTEDGGETWTNTKYSNFEDSYLMALKSVKGGVLLHHLNYDTNNSELFWCESGAMKEKKILYKNIGGNFISELVYLQQFSDTIIMVDNDYFVYKSYDYGENWIVDSINYLNWRINKAYFFNGRVGVLVGMNLTSYVTLDGGETWTKYVHGGGEGFNDIYAKNDKECFIAGKTGRLFYTKDGGHTWKWQDLYTMGLKSITFPTQDTGYVLSNRMLLMTTDAGETWLQKPNKFNYNKIDFVTPKVGFMGFLDELLPKTIDYGNTWSTKYNKTFWENVEPYSFDFRNENEGLVTGKGNLLLYTIDGGQNWEIKETVPNNYYVWSVQNVADKGWLVSVGEEDFYGIFLCDNDFNSQLVFEGDGSDNSARYIICVNDSVYYQPINNTHYISRDYGLTWEDADFDITGQRSFANEHLAYSFDFDYNIHKTYINVRNMGITITQVQNRQLEIATNIVENISANVYLKDANGNSYSLFSSYEIKKDVPFTINIPHNIPQGTYRLFIESLNSAYKDTESEPFEVSDETAVLDISKNQTYRVQGKTLYIYDTKAKLYSASGVELPIQHGYIELKTGVYILVNENETYKIVIQ